ncbi:MAG: aminoacyl-tRNA hydrolase [Candidatus Omnitrophica bacterium]|nr:aminoacyl-tRNA hydrolase [Candidatus Omnitrophota bacterium]
MKLIVGLGNPGRDYRNTRHNIGFKIIDVLSKKGGIRLKRGALDSISGSGRISNERIMLAKPLTYMNLAGRCVRRLVFLHKIDLEDLMVILDDADLEFGRIRLKARGGYGGHRGLQSIIEALGTGEFNRLRMGIGRLESKKLSVYVLDEFTKKEILELKKIIEFSCDALYTWIKEGIEVAMNRFNSNEAHPPQNFGG